MATINIDEDDENADWPKANRPFPSTIEEFREELVFIQITPEEFKKLPVYRMNVKRIPYLRDL